MATDLQISEEADQDIRRAIEWYEHQRFGLGREYADAVEAALESIARVPEIHEPVERGYRRARTRRFPYIILFKLDQQTAVIVGVFHTSRDEKKWQHRLS